MNSSYSLKKLPAPLQTLIRPMLLLSVALHGLLLFVPIPSQPKPEAPKEAEQEKVKITQLPTSNSPPAPKTPKPSPKPSAVVRQPVSQALPRTDAPRQQSVTQLSRPSPSPQAQPTPTATASPSPAAPVDPFGDFPRYQNSQPGSLGLFQGELDQASQQIQEPLTAVAAYFEQELRNRKYELQFTKDETNQKVYQVSKGGTTKFLNLISRDGQGTVIVLASEALDPGNLDDVAKVSPEEQAFFGILDQLSLEQIDQPEFYFADPGLFYAKYLPDADGFVEVEQREGTEGTFRLIPNQSPDQVFNTVFSSSLKQGGFEVIPPTEYGGGRLYEVKKESFVRYLNLVPTKDGTGTIVVLWSSLPN